MSHLVPCLSCQRHVMVSEARCPFCGDALSSEQRASAPPRLPGRRLGRAALFTFGATLIGAAACSDGATGSTDAAKDTPAADSTTDQGGGSGGSGSGGQSGSGGASGTGGSTGDAGGTGGSGDAGDGGGTGGRGDAGGTGGSIAPPYGIGPLYGAPATDR